MIRFRGSKLKILYYMPSYHSSFFEREALRARGHIVDIFVPEGYPSQLLWSEIDILREPRIFRMLGNSLLSMTSSYRDRFLAAVMQRFLFYGKPIWLWSLFIRYTTVYVFGRAEFLQYPKRVSWLLPLAKKLGVRFFLLPAGCRDEALQTYWSSFDDGNVCANCGIRNDCDDKINERNLAIVRQLFTSVAGNGSHTPKQLPVVHIRSRSIDLNLWKPHLEIPEKFRIERMSKFVVLHSFVPNGRYLLSAKVSRNIKGSQYISRAIHDLILEGFSVELIGPSKIPSNEMRFVQAQADLVVDQLIYGWWGSSTLEAMALGKPVICYLRDSFVQNFEECFPEYRSELPVINANPHNVTDVIRNLLMNPDQLIDYGHRSRTFAESFLDPDRNAVELESFFKRDSH